MKRYRRRDQPFVEAMIFQKPFKRVKEFFPEVTLIKGDRGRILFGIVENIVDGRVITRTRINPGEYVIRDEDGHVIRVLPDIFHSLYVEGDR